MKTDQNLLRRFVGTDQYNSFFVKEAREVMDGIQELFRLVNVLTHRKEEEQQKCTSCDQTCTLRLLTSDCKMYENPNKSYHCLFIWLVYTTLEVSEIGGFTLKTHEMFSVHTTPEIF